MQKFYNVKIFGKKTFYGRLQPFPKGLSYAGGRIFRARGGSPRKCRNLAGGGTFDLAHDGPLHRRVPHDRGHEGQRDLEQRPRTNIQLGNMHLSNRERVKKN